ncbi:DUF4265 domain-containing protein [Actinoallomurus sp. NPDC052308]|uniref:DUF4265 domain-containing protein n=1 Tax=Actinoallomurus sp. NPDC052308 TaxID=3155530 RepID=UPI0034297BC8
MENKTYIVHDRPAVMESRQHIAMVDLEPFGFLNQFEQIWLGYRSDGLFELHCIPFRIYGASLFDIVRIDDSDFLVEVVRRSSHRALRALIAPNLADLQSVRERIVSDASDSGLLLEWSGDRHIAIDVPEGRTPEHLLNYFAMERASNRIFWEWSDVKPFKRNERP